MVKSAIERLCSQYEGLETQYLSIRGQEDARVLVRSRSELKEASSIATSLAGRLRSLSKCISYLPQGDHVAIADVLPQNGDIKTIPPIYDLRVLEACEDLRVSLTGFLTGAVPTDILHLGDQDAKSPGRGFNPAWRAQERDLATTLDLALGADTVLDIARQLSSSRGTRKTKVKAQQLGARLDSLPIKDVVLFGGLDLLELSHGQRKELALACISELNSPSHDWVPGEISEFRSRVRRRDQEVPFYAFAAEHWFEFAQELWSDLGANIMDFFAPERENNRLQWILEFARRLWPAKYGPMAFSPRAHVCLVEATHDLLPIHVAAALGLPALCRQLLQNATQTKFGSQAFWNSPLWCALVGPAIINFADVDRDPSLKELISGPRPVNQEETLKVLVEAGNVARDIKFDQDTKPPRSSRNPRWVAFLVALMIGNPELYLQLEDNPSGLDSHFLRQLEANGAFDLIPKQILKTEKCRLFLDCVFQEWLDRLLPDHMDGDILEDLYHAIWRIIHDLRLECGNVLNKRRIETLSDEEFDSLLFIAANDASSNLVQHMIRDPRWNPNKSYNGTTNEDGGTLLHAAMTTENLQTVRLILESGADVEARDLKGRTPILLADSIETLEELRKHDADMSVSDREGHNIWHYQATEMDDEILEWLATHDTNKHPSLRAVSKKGRTPFAEALWTVRDLAKLYKGTKERRPVAARAILKACGGDFDGVFVCDVPLLSLVAEWGDEPLLDDLIDAWAGKSPPIVEQSNPLHHVNFSASSSFVKKLQDLSQGTCLLLEDKKTAAETIFTNFKYIPKLLRIRGQPNITQPLALSAHPSCKQELPEETYMQLLTPDVVSSEDSDGRDLWQRICIDNVAGWATTVETPIVQDSLMTALRCLAQGEVLKNYEDRTGKCGLTLIPEAFMKGSRQVEIPNWMSAVFQLLLAQTTRLEEFKKSNHSLLCMRWAVRGGHKELLADLLERGLSVHARLEGTTMLEECCSANHPCDPATFTQLLKRADKSKLNEVDEYGQGLIHLLISPAVRFRDDKLKILLEHGADPNLRRAGNAPALVTYILERQLEAAYFLLDKGADFTLATKDGLDAALATASRGSTRLLAKIKSLAKPDFDWKRTCTSRFTIFHPGGQNTTFYASECNALHMAAFNGHDLVIQYYMSNFDIDPNAAVQDDLRRPAHFAALGGWSPCLRMLHSKGADLSLQARDGSTALHVATKSCQPGAVKALLELAPKNLPDRDGMTPYLHALRIGVKEIVDIFNGFMPAILPDRPRERATRKKARLLGGALETLTGLGDIESYRNVVRSTSPEEIDGAVLKCGGCTPIILAVRKGKTQLACYLVAAGCRGLTGSCKKHFGPLGGFDALTEICELEDLPAGAAGPAPQPPPGMAAWPEATQAMFAQTCYPFLEAYLRSGICWLAAALSPVHAVAHRNNLEAFNAIMTHLEIEDNPSAYRSQLLLSGKNRLSRSALSAPRNEWIKELQRLAVNQPITHASLHDPYEEGWTPLHVAMDSEAFEVAAALLERGADVDATDRARCTPLHVAVRKEFAPGVAMLLARGANPDARDHTSYTPLMRAAEHGHVEIARLLVQHGADTRVHEPDGMSLLNICGEQSKNPAMFEYLLTLGLDPYTEDKAGYMPLHDMILNRDFTAYVMNGDFDFARVRDINKGLMPMVVELNRHGAAAILKRLLLRLASSSLGSDGLEGQPRADVESGRARATDLASRYPPRFVSALCQAVHRDELDCLPLLVGPLGGVDVDAEGAVEGSALIVACVKGRLEAVRILVRLGARTAYAFEERDEETGEVVVLVRNAVVAAKRFPDVVRWLLVGRYSEILRLGDGSVDIGEDTEDDTEEDTEEDTEDTEGDDDDDEEEEEEEEEDDDDDEDEESEDDEEREDYTSSASEVEKQTQHGARQTEEQNGDASMHGSRAQQRKTTSGIRPWSGVRVAEVELLGVGDQFGFCRDESRFEYLRRMANLRKSFRNMRVHPRGWFEMASADQLAESRWHVP